MKNFETVIAVYVDFFPLVVISNLKVCCRMIRTEDKNDRILSPAEVSSDTYIVKMLLHFLPFKKV